MKSNQVRDIKDLGNLLHMLSEQRDAAIDAATEKIRQEFNAKRDMALDSYGITWDEFEQQWQRLNRRYRPNGGRQEAWRRMTNYFRDTEISRCFRSIPS